MLESQWSLFAQTGNNIMSISTKSKKSVCILVRLTILSQVSAHPWLCKLTMEYISSVQRFRGGLLNKGLDTPVLRRILTERKLAYKLTFFFRVFFLAHKLTYFSRVFFPNTWKILSVPKLLSKQVVKELKKGSKHSRFTCESKINWSLREDNLV